MSETDRLIQTLKLELRSRNKNYGDLTDVLGLSHASIKRLFAERNFSLVRLEQICQFLEIEMSDLVHAMEKNADRLDQLTIEQERELVNNEKLLCMAHSLMNHWTFEEVISTYTISVTEGVHFMAMLDKMKLIEMLPGNSYKLLIARKFRWITGGPIQQFFQKQLQNDFLNASFNRPDESRLFVSSMLSNASIEQLLRKLEKLSNEVNELHQEDEKLPLKLKRGMSLLLAARPWETPVFAALRR